MKSRQNTEAKWHEQSEQARSEAAKLPAGKDRECLLRKARQLEVACDIADWISSSRPKPT
jgi:hypothetical protein